MQYATGRNRRRRRRGPILTAVGVIAVGVLYFGVDSVLDHFEDRRYGFKVGSCVKFRETNGGRPEPQDAPCDASGMVFEVATARVDRTGDGTGADCPSGPYAKADRSNHGATFDSGLAYYYACLIPRVAQDQCYDVIWGDHPDTQHTYVPVPDCAPTTIKFVDESGRPLSGVVRIAAVLDSADGDCPAGSDRRFSFDVPGRAFCVTDVLA